MTHTKSLGRRLLELVFNPHRFNDTAVYELYCQLRHPKYYEAKQQEITFYHTLIRQAGGGLVFDVGSNEGDRAVIFADVADRVICVEPSPAAIRILENRFAKSPTISIIAKGVGSQPGSSPFHMFGEIDCYNTFSSKWADSLKDSNDETKRPHKKVIAVVDVPVTTLDSLIEQFGTPSYIKIDVEGFEIEVIKGLSRSVRLISIECNLPEFESETLDCLARLEEIQSKPRFNYCTTEPPINFSSERWVSYSEMAHIVAKGGHSFMEIFSKSF
jgi:FkbM family methyltransferase